MATERRDDIEAAIVQHLRASDEPVREAYLYERVNGDGLGTDPAEFLAALMRLETEGHVHLDPARDDTQHDPEPFQPRFWRVVS